MGDFSCFVIGEDTLTHRCGELLIERGHDVRGVITASPHVLEWAVSRGLRVIDPTADLHRELDSEPFDYLFSIANLRILDDALVALPSIATINFHDGPLPAYAGVHSSSWALMQGEAQHGVSWVHVTDVIDGGAVAAQRILDIAEDETSFSLNTKCFEAGMETFDELIREIAAGTNRPWEQDLERRSYFGMWKRPAAAGMLAWSRTAHELRSIVRALDLGPSHQNVLGVAKIRIGDHLYICRQAELAGADATAAPGKVVDLTDEAMTVSTGQGDLSITEVTSLIGEPTSIEDLRAEAGLHLGMQLTALDEAETKTVDDTLEAVARHERYWAGRLADLRPVEIPYLDKSAATGDATVGFDVTVPPEFAALAAARWGEHDAQSVITAAFALYIGRLSAAGSFSVGLESGVEGDPGLFAARVPWNCSIDRNAPAAGQLSALLETLATAVANRTHLLDLWSRLPQLRDIAGRGGLPTFPLGVALSGAGELPEGTDVGLRCNGPDVRLDCRPPAVRTADGERMARQFSTFLGTLAGNPDRAVNELTLLTDEETRQMLWGWNDTAHDYPSGATIPHLFAEQVLRSPDAVAVACGDDELSYAELDRRSNQLARRLLDLGVGREVVVGLSVDRSIHMVIALLAIHKAGGAYLPLDPTYPKERIAFILEDASAEVLITNEALLDSLPPHRGELVLLDRDWAGINGVADGPLDVELTPDQLAYVIYTSGSTGKPKGVMVEHGNAVSFFAGMDERIPHREGDVWLAVTSLSFDISVLEIFWTLCRGLEVVIYDNHDLAGGAEGTDTPLDYSLFYFSADADEDPSDKYRLLTEGAKFADTNGFSAIWTPERHFHAFGGLYPNPAVTGAAVAMITDNVQIRSGSVVAPLHSPIRIAEEWSVVDNLSGGRAAVSFASGWMPEDFVIRPDDYEDKKEATFSHMETVRRLWRGEAVEFPAPNGSTVAVETLPRPLQPELPVWVTTAGNPATYQAAAEAGAYVLTHLLGQTVEEVGEKVAAYRRAWKAAGHPGDGHVSLMVHTFVGADHDTARETVRRPLKEYLRTAANLLKTYSSTFPTFRNQGISADQVNFGDLPEEDLDAVLDFAFQRYFETSGLFGTAETCAAMIERIKANDIDEVACLIDFGVPTDVVLESLPHLDALRVATTGAPATAGGPTIAALIRDRGVTHFQCTPSMARMLLADNETREAMRGLQVMMVGGEACSVSLADELFDTVERRILNMYGPTETTIWSATQELLGEDGAVPIGKPIPNTHFFVVNEAMVPQPVGVPGELLIGGPGVTRGYLDREALTAERFVENPFGVDGSPRLYRTGDLVRYLPDGRVEFLGRIDHQVKIRGHRIELGEIETTLHHHPAVREAVVMAREDVPDDLRLVAYLTTVAGEAVATSEIRDHVRNRLPEYMVPSRVVQLDEFPQTPNNKIDRGQLPAPADEVPDHAESLEQPIGPVETRVASIWTDALAIQSIGRTDDFFELGGDSLSLVHVTSRISDVFGQKVSIGAFVTAPTIAAVAQLLDESGLAADPEAPEDHGADVENGEIVTRPMRQCDLDAVIGMHQHHFPSWKVTQLGRPFLQRMYEWFMESHGDLALVAVRDGEVIGFTVGTVGPYKRQLLRYAMPAAARGAATNPMALIRTTVRDRLPRATKGVPAAELDTRMDDPTLANNRIMALSSTAEGGGLALMIAFENAAVQRGTEPYFHEHVTVVE